MDNYQSGSDAQADDQWVDVTKPPPTMSEEYWREYYREADQDYLRITHRRINEESPTPEEELFEYVETRKDQSD